MKRQFYKTLFACTIFLGGIIADTQAQVDSLRLTLDNIFQYVDKSQVPTGFLDEYGAQFANLKAYNGIPREAG